MKYLILLLSIAFSGLLLSEEIENYIVGTAGTPIAVLINGQLKQVEHSNVTLSKCFVDIESGASSQIEHAYLEIHEGYDTELITIVTNVKECLKPINKFELDVMDEGFMERVLSWSIANRLSPRFVYQMNDGRYEVKLDMEILNITDLDQNDFLEIWFVMPSMYGDDLYYVLEEDMGGTFTVIGSYCHGFD